MKRLNVKILLLIAIAVIISVVFSAIVSVVQSRGTIIDITTSNVADVLETSSGNLTVYLHEKEKLLNTLTSLEKFEERDVDSLTNSLQNTVENFDDINSVYFADDNGEFFIHPEVELDENYNAEERDWYKSAKGKEKVVWTDPYQDYFTGEWIITASKAVYSGDKFIGVIGIDIDLNSFNQSLAHIEIGEKGYLSLVNKQGTIIYHPDTERTGEDISEQEYYLKMMEVEEGHFEYKHGKDDYVYVVTINDKSGVLLVGVISKDELAKESNAIMLYVLISTLIVSAIGITVSYIFTNRGIVKPIRELTEKMKAFEDGDLTAQVEFNSDDEIGELGFSFNTMTLQMRELVKEIQRSNGNVSSSVNITKQSASENSAASGEIAMTVEELANGATLQAEKSEEINNAMEFFGDSIQEIVSSSEMIQSSMDGLKSVSLDSQEKLRNLMDTNQKSTEISNETARAMEELLVEADKINDMVEAIDKITQDTNLLSLNARIEAAHAGEYGRGFAIVANEIQKLSQQSDATLREIQETTDAIKEQIDQLKHKVEDSNEMSKTQNDITGEVRDAFVQVQQSIEEGVELITTIIAAMQEVAIEKDTVIQHVHEISSTTQQSAAGTEEVAASVEEQNSSMQQLLEIVTELESNIEQLNKYIARFKVE